MVRRVGKSSPVKPSGEKRWQLNSVGPRGAVISDLRVGDPCIYLCTH